VKAVVYGLVLTALVQGLLVGVGYWIAGAGAPVFLAALTTVCGLIPFAAPTVWIGVGVGLFVKGSTAAAVGLAIWGAIVLGWTDHIVRPFLISREAAIPFILVLFGVLGGLASFGLVGLFIGPVILAVLLAVWREWLFESRQPAAL
jgi:predicted PurR-regulated permease PerM